MEVFWRTIKVLAKKKRGIAYSAGKNVYLLQEHALGELKGYSALDLKNQFSPSLLLITRTQTRTQNDHHYHYLCY